MEVREHGETRTSQVTTNILKEKRSSVFHGRLHCQKMIEGLRWSNSAPRVDNPTILFLFSADVSFKLDVAIILIICF